MRFGWVDDLCLVVRGHKCTRKWRKAWQMDGQKRRRLRPFWAAHLPSSSLNLPTWFPNLVRETTPPSFRYSDGWQAGRQKRLPLLAILLLPTACRGCRLCKDCCGTLDKPRKGCHSQATRGGGSIGKTEEDLRITLV